VAVDIATRKVTKHIALKGCEEATGMVVCFPPQLPGHRRSDCHRNGAGYTFGVRVGDE